MMGRQTGDQSQLFYMFAAIVQNLKTLASHIWRPPLSEPAACA